MPEFKNSVIIVGGGLAGLAAAYWAKRQDPGRDVTLLEKETAILHWTGRRGLENLVAGRVSQSAMEAESAVFRGFPAAVGLLQKWPPEANREWLQSIGAELVESGDGSFCFAGRCSPADLFMKTLESLGVVVRCGYSLEAFSRQPDGSFRLWSTEGNPLASERLVLATGGERNHGMALVRELGVETTPVVPAFVRLKTASPKPGQSIGPISRHVSLRCPVTGVKEQGTATLSPRGLEGPVVSRLSAGFPLEWSQRRYRISLEVDWLPEVSAAALRGELDSRCLMAKRKRIGEEPHFNFEIRQWQAFLDLSRIEPDTAWARLKPRKLETLIQRIKNHSIAFAGMGLPLGERAWAGGIAPHEIDWSNGMCRKVPGLYLAGEMLDLLGAPGGGHLNCIWSTGYLAGTGSSLKA